jgi:hypothetical protein
LFLKKIFLFIIILPLNFKTKYQSEFWRKIMAGNSFVQRNQCIIVTIATLIFFLFSQYPIQADDLKIMSAEDKATLLDYVKTLKDTGKEAQGKFNNFLTYWETINDNFPKFGKQAQGIINKLNNAGLTSKVKSASHYCGQMGKAVDGAMKRKEQVENILSVIDIFRPQKDNPFGSLEKLIGLLDLLESFLPDTDKINDLGTKATIFLVKTGINYLRTALKNARKGIKGIQKRLRERAGNCINFVGGDATVDKSDLKRSSFVQQFANKINEDVICYSGVRPIKSEVWKNTNGDGVYLWSNKTWTKLDPGFGLVEDIFASYRLAYKKAISGEQLIFWCNDNLARYMEASKMAKEHYNRLFGGDTNCHNEFFEEAQLGQLWRKLVGYQNNKERYMARYIFEVKGVRQASQILINTLKSMTYIFGEIKDLQGSPISGASVILTASGKKSTAITDGDGKYRILHPVNWISKPRAQLQISHRDHKTKMETTRIICQCRNLGIQKLTKIIGEQRLNLIIQPNNPVLKLNQSVKFSSLILDENGKYIDVSNQTQFSPSRSFMAKSSGNFTITAQYKDKVVTTVVLVKGKKTIGLSIMPQNPVIPLKGNVQFSAKAHFSDNTAMDVTKVAVFAPSKQFKGTKVGQHVVTVVYDGLSSSTTVTVEASARANDTQLDYDPGGLKIIGPNQIISGQSAHYLAMDGLGKTQYKSGVTWNSSVEDVLVIGAAGNGYGFKPGRTVIIAKHQGNTAYYDVTVLARVPNLINLTIPEARSQLSGMNLRLVFVGNLADLKSRPEARITAQSIAPGETIEANRAVRVKVSEDGQLLSNQGNSSQVNTSGAGKPPLAVQKNTKQKKPKKKKKSFFSKLANNYIKNLGRVIAMRKSDKKSKQNQQIEKMNKQNKVSSSTPAKLPKKPAVFDPLNSTTGFQDPPKQKPIKSNHQDKIDKDNSGDCTWRIGMGQVGHWDTKGNWSTATVGPELFYSGKECNCGPKKGYEVVKYWDHCKKKYRCFAFDITN